LPRRRPARWRLVGVIVAVLLDLATPAVSTAQDTATGTVVVPGPTPTGVAPAAVPGSPWSMNRVQVDLGYTYDDNVTRGRAADDFAAIRARMEELQRERDQVVADQKDRLATGPRPYYRPEGSPSESENWSAPSTALPEVRPVRGLGHRRSKVFQGLMGSGASGP
jgi:hypothetical protein